MAEVRTVASPRDRVLDVLDGKSPERVPFIIWDNKLPSPKIERRLLELGACIIVKSTVWASRLEGVEVRREDLLGYVQQSDYLDAERKACELLARAPTTRRRLEQKLRGRGFGAELVERVIARVTELGYLDDTSFAESWVRFRLERHPEGRAALCAGLQRRGIDRATAEAVVGRVSEADELAAAQRVAARTVELSFVQAVRKLSARGFPAPLVRRVQDL